MNIGTKVIINKIEFTIWFIENNVYHLIDKDGYGICGDIEWLNNIIE